MSAPGVGDRVRVRAELGWASHRRGMLGTVEEVEDHPCSLLTHRVRLDGEKSAAWFTALEIEQVHS